MSVNPAGARGPLTEHNAGHVKGGRSATRYLIGAICVLVIALMISPLALSVLASIKEPSDAQRVPPDYLPHSFTFQNYGNIFHYGVGLPTYLGNSVLVAAITIAICVSLSVTAGYGLARFKIRFKEVWFLLLLAPMMIPYQALLTPLYLAFAKIGIANSQLGLGIVHAMFQLPFSVYLMRNSFESIPREIEEAARVDGASSIQTLLRVFLPLVAPGVLTVAMFAFIASWNEVLSSLIFINKETLFTVPIMLVNVRSSHQGAVDWGTLQAGVVISVVPSILIYLMLQKYYVSGLLSGAVK